MSSLASYSKPPNSSCYVGPSGTEETVNGRQRLFVTVCGNNKIWSGARKVAWSHAVYTRGEMGQVNGYLLVNSKGNTPKLAEYSELFVHYLCEVQATTGGIIPEDLNVGEEYGLPNLAGRVTTHARSEGVSE